MTRYALLFSLCLPLGVQAADLPTFAAKLVAASGLKAPTAVISPGTRLNINGRPGGAAAVVVGEDPCPDGLPEPSGCIVLDKPAVAVRIYLEGRVFKESWTVTTQNGRTHLSRPDGTIISQD